MTSDGKYYFAREGNMIFFKLTGTLKYTISSKFDTFLDRLLEAGSDFDDVLIDLSEARFLDSTNLGFLARIAEFMTEKHCKKVTIYSPGKEINEILESVGFDEVFILISDMEKPYEGLNEITPAEQEERSRSVMMLDAHRALMKVSEKNAEKFRDVVELLEKSVKKPE